MGKSGMARSRMQRHRATRGADTRSEKISLHGPPCTPLTISRARSTIVPAALSHACQPNSQEMPVYAKDPDYARARSVGDSRRRPGAGDPRPAVSTQL
jgi:hypothetical protein